VTEEEEVAKDHAYRATGEQPNRVLAMVASHIRNTSTGI
jgi:hypothetical protein